MIIRRDLYLKKLLERKHNRLVKIVTGLRRCGKSFLLNTLLVAELKNTGVADDHIIFLSLEGLMNSQYRDPEFTYQHIASLMKDSSMYYIIIDEIQMMDRFVEFLNSLILIPNADVYVTGSNSRFLSSDIATEFRGRGDVVQLHPLRFSEFLSAYDGDKLDAWDDYFIYGGMPQILSYQSNESKAEYLQQLFQNTYTRDLVERNKLRNENNLDELFNVIASATGSFTNPSKLEKTFRSVKQVSFPRATIDFYIRCMEDAFLVSKAQKYDVKGKQYIGTPYKIYFEDVGLRNARLNFRQTEENHIMENIIYNDLKARGFNVDIGVVEYFTKDNTGKTIRKDCEVDFIVNRGSQRVYIQSAYEIPDNAKMEQEKNSLRRINDSFRKIIITKDYMKPRTDDDGIIRMGIINFLLDDTMI
ncbi:MAG: ATP-binding protein [Acidaminococcaceae bacterium]|nr:ATP-binding protein [Acidaminococcaceae bacterium]